MNTLFRGAPPQSRASSGCVHARRRAAPGGRRQIATSAAGSSSSSSSSSARSKGYPITPKAIQVDQETAIKGVELPDVANAPADFNKGDMSKTVLGVILGGGAGTRLYPLTKKRAKPQKAFRGAG